MNRLGYYGKQTAGVFVSNSDRIVIRNNKIHDIPRGILSIYIKLSNTYY